MHSPKEFVDMLTPGLEKEGAIIRLSDSLEIYTHSSVMNETDLIIQSWTMSTITKPRENGLLNAIKMVRVLPVVMEARVTHFAIMKRINTWLEVSR